MSKTIRVRAIKAINNITTHTKRVMLKTSPFFCFYPIRMSLKPIVMVIFAIIKKTNPINYQYIY
jgi:uncharacterized Tic20 family protein